MTSITDAARADPAWAAMTGIARLERGRRAAESRRFCHADQRLLWMFSDGVPRTLRAIADELGLEQSTVNRQVNAAVDSGRLRRFRESGQKALHFLATDSALEEFSRELRAQLDLLDRALSAVPPSDRGRFLDQFEAFADAYNEAASDA